MRSASCPGAAPGLSDFGDLSAQLVRNLSAVSNGAASRLCSGFSALAMPCRASGLWPRSPADGSNARRRVAAITAAKKERSAKPGSIPMPRRSLYKLVRSRRQPTTHQVAAIRRTAIHNKERTPLRALVFSYPQVFHGGCFGVSGTPPLRLFIYIFI